MVQLPRELTQAALHRSQSTQPVLQSAKHVAQPSALTVPYQPAAHTDAGQPARAPLVGQPASQEPEMPPGEQRETLPSARRIVQRPVDSREAGGSCGEAELDLFLSSDSESVS